MYLAGLWVPRKVEDDDNKQSGDPATEEKKTDPPIKIVFHDGETKAVRRIIARRVALMVAFGTEVSFVLLQRVPVIAEAPGPGNSVSATPCVPVVVMCAFEVGHA
jgi:hypothetical protein